MEKISIIIPVYNVSKYIKKSLQSALCQTYADIEYLIIDDKGTDDSIRIVKEIIHSSTKDIKIIEHNKNMGLSEARNTGLLYATGKYVFFMDSDDELTPDCIQLHYDALKKYNADFTVANIQLIGAKSIHVKNKIKLNVQDQPIKSFLKQQWSVSAWNKLYKKEFLLDNKLHFKKGIIHEDILWSFLISCKATQLALVEQATYLYKIRNNSLTTQANNSKKLESLLYILDEIIKYSKTNKINITYKKYFNKFISFWKFNTALLLLNFNGSTKEKIDFYNSIKQISSGINIYTLILKLPYWLFKLVLFIPYTIYKRL